MFSFSLWGILCLIEPFRMCCLIFHASSSVQSLSHVRLFATPWIAAQQASLSIKTSRSSLRLTSVELAMPSSHLIFCRPLFFVPPIPPSVSSFQSQLFEWDGQSTGVSALGLFLPKNTKVWSPLEWTGWTPCCLWDSQESSPTPKFKNAILWCSAFFTAQLSHPYMTTWKTTALTRRSFVGKVMFLLLNKLSRLVITFLPRSKCLLISWLQSPSVVILLSPPPN